MDKETHSNVLELPPNVKRRITGQSLWLMILDKKDADFNCQHNYDQVVGRCNTMQLVDLEGMGLIISQHVRALQVFGSGLINSTGIGWNCILFAWLSECWSCIGMDQQTGMMTYATATTFRFQGSWEEIWKRHQQVASAELGLKHLVSNCC